MEKVGEPRHRRIKWSPQAKWRPTDVGGGESRGAPRTEGPSWSCLRWLQARGCPRWWRPVSGETPHRMDVKLVVVLRPEFPGRPIECSVRAKMVAKMVSGRGGRPHSEDQVSGALPRWLQAGGGPRQSSQAEGQVSGVCHDGLWWMSTSSVACPESIDCCGSSHGKGTTGGLVCESSTFLHADPGHSDLVHS